MRGHPRRHTVSAPRLILVNHVGRVSKHIRGRAPQLQASLPLMQQSRTMSDNPVSELKLGRADWPLYEKTGNSVVVERCTVWLIYIVVYHFIPLDRHGRGSIIF